MIKTSTIKTSTIRTSSTKNIVSMAIGLLLLSMACIASAQPAEAPEKDTARDALIAQLVEMPREERIAFLRNMSQEERDGLWFQVQQALYSAGSSGALTPRAIEVDRTIEGPAVNGTIQYDSGFPSVAYSPGSPFLLGNRFDTHRNDGDTNQVPATGTLSTVRALVVPGQSSGTTGTTSSIAPNLGGGPPTSAGFVMHGPQTVGGGAMALFSSFTAASGLIDTVEFTGIGATYTGSEFFVLFGVFSNVHVPAFGTETTMGQGHHGVAGNTGGMGPNVTSITPITTPGPVNGFIRATGAIVPVELMTFEVE